ncbi:MAG: hypothetical protein LBJ02_12475 [Bifidobacteriaceae bacterium]|jgi:hypothetical protein|nr:hypothetical protein [Bifidobacteriaceae bacterium]
MRKSPALPYTVSMISQELLDALDKLGANEKREVIMYLQTGSRHWVESLSLTELSDIVERIEALFVEPNAPHSKSKSKSQQVSIQELRRLIHGS